MDLDRSSEVWCCRPATHKTEHHGRERVVFIGPKGQAVLGHAKADVTQVYAERDQSLAAEVMRKIG